MKGDWLDMLSTGIENRLKLSGHLSGNVIMNPEILEKETWFYGM